MPGGERAVGLGVADEALRDHVPHGKPARALAVHDGELADGQLDQLGGERMLGVVRPPDASAGLPDAFDEPSVGHRGQARRGGDAEGERRAHARVVVGGEDHLGTVGLEGQQRAVGRGYPAVVLDRVAAVPSLRRVGGVGHPDGERMAAGDRPCRSDDQLVAVAYGLGRCAVDGDGVQGVAREVEVEAGQGLGGGGAEGGGRGEGRARRAPVEGEGVAAHRVAPVAVEWQERVTDAPGAG